MSHAKTVVGLLALIGGMGSIPYLTRQSQSHSLFDTDKKLSGSQRQRGMNLMAGQHDAGPDPNYDAKTGTYKKYSNRSAGKAS